MIGPFAVEHRHVGRLPVGVVDHVLEEHRRRLLRPGRGATRAVRLKACRKKSTSALQPALSPLTAGGSWPRAPGPANITQEGTGEVRKSRIRYETPQKSCLPIGRWARSRPPSNQPRSLVRYWLHCSSKGKGWNFRFAAVKTRPPANVACRLRSSVAAITRFFWALSGTASLGFA